MTWMLGKRGRSVPAWRELHSRAQGVCSYQLEQCPPPPQLHCVGMAPVAFCWLALSGVPLGPDLCSFELCRPAEQRVPWLARRVGWHSSR